MNTTLARPAVQPAARRPFGFGLSAKPQRDNTVPVARRSDEDAAWWASASAEIEAARELARLDARAAEAHEMDLMVAGIGW